MQETRLRAGDGGMGATRASGDACMQQSVEDQRCLVAGLVACMQQGVEDQRCLVAGLVACNKAFRTRDATMA
jgi:hypothetical protein